MTEILEVEDVKHCPLCDKFVTEWNLKKDVFVEWWRYVCWSLTGGNKYFAMAAAKIRGKAINSTVE